MIKVWKPEDTYEYSDFNRIESTVKAAYSQFRKAMSLHDPIETITDRDISSIFVVEDINRIEKNLKYVDFSKTFERKVWEEGKQFTYDDANRWEQMADLLRRAMAGIQAIRCGTHRCGTWPIYSVIGLVVKRTTLYNSELQSGTYEAVAVGTLPMPSVIGATASKEHIVELQGGSVSYQVDLTGTKPEISVIGLVTKHTSTVEGGCAIAAFEIDECGDVLAGTKPEIATIGKVITKEHKVAADGADALYTVDPAGTKPDISTIGLATEQIIQAGKTKKGAVYKIKAAGMKYCGEEAQNGRSGDKRSPDQ